MKISFDLHTHTVYSHGKGTIAENAMSAKEKGLSGIAITDHGFSHPVYGMRRRKLDEMRERCVEAEKESGIKVLLGIESNVRGISGRIDVEERDYDKLDVVLAGVHKLIICDRPVDTFKMLVVDNLWDVFKWKPSQRLIKYNTTCYINAIKNNPIDVITHVNYGCPCDPVEVAKCAADYGTYIEISTKKTHLSLEQWQDVIDKTNARFVVDSDAHSVDRIGDSALAEKLFKEINFPAERIANIDGKMPALRFGEFKKHR
ncbi:MAG: PHP domain-containing protein [Clostridia bacterium]|nr:PHP domain-containing protein [Clostridia bacterium]